MCVSRVQTMHLGHQSPKSIFLFKYYTTTTIIIIIIFIIIIIIIIIIFNLQSDVSYPFVLQDPALMNQHTNSAFQTDDQQHGYFTLNSREPGKKYM